MTTNRNRQAFGLLAIAAGLIALLANLGIYQVSELITGLLTGLFGAVFLGAYARDHERWWALIPGVILVTMGGVMIVARYGNGNWAGVMTLGGIGLAFLAVLLARPGAWWAIIPAGTMFSLSALVYANDILKMNEPVFVLFFGLALTFAVVSLMRQGERRMYWALVPAAILGIFAALFVVGRPELFNLVWPTALILGGLYYALRGSGAGKPPISHAP